MTAPTSADWLDLAERLEHMRSHALAGHVEPLDHAVWCALHMAGLCALDERRNPTTVHREGSQ